jgi:hypothetical protein
MRTLEDLVSSAEPAWPSVLQWVRDATNPLEILAVDDARRTRALLELQVTTRSPMGAIVFETGGILVDGGWLRILGSGHPRLPRSIGDWNAGRNGGVDGETAPFLLVADDVVGGFFAINGGGLPGAAGSVAYFAPDTLDWQDLELSYTSFLHFAMSGDLEHFYADSRWTGWRDEIINLPGDCAISVYPFLWAAGPSIDERSRRPVPIAELWAVQLKMRSQMNGAG